MQTNVIVTHLYHMWSEHILQNMSINSMTVLKLDPFTLRQLARDLVSLADALDAEMAPGTFDHEADLKNWYLQRVQWLVATGQRASRKDDELAFAATGFPVTRESIRKLRREFAPPDWSKPGRPRRGKVVPPD